VSGDVPSGPSGDSVDDGGPRPGRSRWYESGEDPDYRFSLANERTFLAWFRTALALVASAVALKQLIPPFRIPGIRTGLSLVLTAAGLSIAVTAYRHWAACELAMRRQESLPRPGLMPWIAGALAVVAVVVAIAVVLEGVA
jgi:putative membrane protein